MIAASLLIAASLGWAAQVNGPSPTVSSDVPLGSITFPDEIAPAIMPYLDCLYDSHGVRRGPPGDSQTIPSPDLLGADCGEARRHAASRAESILRTQNRGSTSQRRAYVERVLGRVDRFAATLETPPQGPK